MTKHLGISIALLGTVACQSYPFVAPPEGYATYSVVNVGNATVGTTTGGPDQNTGGTTSGPTGGTGTGTSTGGNTIVEHYTVNSVPSTDILFVIDSSGSMADKQDRLASNAQQFINTLVASGNPFRIGIVSTDVVDNKEQGRLHNMGAANVFYLDAPAKNDPQAAQKGQALIDAFVTAVKAVGVLGDSRESGEMTAMRALGVSEIVDANVVAYNTGFSRADADLAVVIVTDEDDCSRTAASLGMSSVTSWSAEDCYSVSLEAQRLQPDAVIAGLAKAKNNDVTRVRVGMIIAGVAGSDGTFNAMSCYTAGTTPSSACGCWSRSGGGSVANIYCDVNSANGQACDIDTTGTCNQNTSCLTPAPVCVTQCSAMGGHRYYDALKALSTARVAKGASPGTAVGSICDGSFASVLTDIASNVVAPSCFKLPSAPTAQMTFGVNIVQQGAAPRAVPELNPAHAGACTTCGGACGTGSWTVAGQSICLGCGLFLQPGDRLDVSITTPAN